MFGVMWLQKFSNCQDWVLLLGWYSAALLSDIEYSNSQSFNSVQHYLFQAFNVSLHVECVAMKEDEWRHNVIIVSDHPKYHDVDWVFDFHPYQYILWGQNKPTSYFQISGRVNCIIVLLSLKCPADSSLQHSRSNLKQTKH